MMLRLASFAPVAARAALSLPAAKAGNLDALKARLGPTGASCKACYDSFRER